MNAKQRRTRNRGLAFLTRVRHDMRDKSGRYSWSSTWSEEEFWRIISVEGHAQQIKDEMQSAIMKAIDANKKIAFTDAGIGQIEKVIREQIEKIAEDPLLKTRWEDTVTLEPAQPVDKEARIVRGVKVTMPLHPIMITGSFTV